MSVTDTMTPEMKSLYKDFYGNVDRLKGEWDLCTAQYDQALALAISKEGTVYDRLTLRKISDYWIRRRHALQRSLPNDILEKLKK
jgi:hypothetical protein